VLEDRRRTRSGSTLVAALLATFAASPAGAQAQTQRLPRVLALGAQANYQHDSLTDALVTVYDLGRESGLWETVIRTDTELLTRRPLERNAKNLDSFDAVFFLISGELPLAEEQKRSLLDFVHEGGGFVGAHGATAALAEWPGYVDLVGGTFDGHPWNQVEVELVVEDPSFPAVAHFPERFRFRDEIYQIAEFSRERSHVLISLDTSSVDMQHEGVKQTDNPIAWTRRHGEGRVFYSSLGHASEIWSREDVRRMWLEAVKWALGIGESE
jgi:type 1 glutamine amidotransferase